MQALQRGLAELAGAGGAEAAADALRIVDTYIKVRLAPILYSISGSCLKIVSHAYHTREYHIVLSAALA